MKDKISVRTVRTAMKTGNKDIGLYTAESIQQRAALVLKDVRYVVSAHFEMTDQANDSDNPGKFQDIIKRRLTRGQCFHTPYLGVREFPANFQIWDKTKPVHTAYQGEKDLGYMLYDMDYQGENGIEPTFFHAILNDGRLDLQHCEVLR